MGNFISRLAALVSKPRLGVQTFGKGLNQFTIEVNSSGELQGLWIDKAHPPITKLINGRPGKVDHAWCD